MLNRGCQRLLIGPSKARSRQALDQRRLLGQQGVLLSVTPVIRFPAKRFDHTWLKLA
jgi:hypothetical protein